MDSFDCNMYTTTQATLVCTSNYTRNLKKCYLAAVSSRMLLAKQLQYCAASETTTTFFNKHFCDYEQICCVRWCACVVPYVDIMFLYMKFMHKTFHVNASRL